MEAFFYIPSKLQEMIKLLLWIPIVAAFVWIDWYTIKVKKVKPNHYLGWTLRGMAAILYGVFVFNPKSEWPGFHVMSYLSFSFLLTFNPSINLARGLAWDYIGKESYFDKFFSKRRGLYYMLNLMALGMMIVSAIYLMKYE